MTLPDRGRNGRRSSDVLGRYEMTMVGDPSWPARRISGPYDKPLYRKSDGRAGGPAGRHPVVHLRNTTRGLEIRPEASINGVFAQARGRVPIGAGTRVRIGDYLLEYRAGGGASRVEPLCEGGERLFVRDPGIVDELVFVRPDGSYGPAIPLFQTIVLGRGGADDPQVDVPLHDENVSRRHAQVLPMREGAVIEDLGSTNGTFVALDGVMYVEDEIVLRLGEARLRIARLD
jgi:hypothetical protein